MANRPSTLLDQTPESEVMTGSAEPIGDAAAAAGAESTAALTTQTISIFERLAKDPSVEPAKLRELIDLQEHILARNAEAAFWDAFSDMQGELPTIDEDGRIVVNSQVRSRYSTNENLQETIRPILAAHGFSISFRNRVTEKGARVVKGILAHRGGHKEFDEFESAPDDGGSMNSIQRIGSQRSYGQRYTTIALLNIVSRAKIDRDDDAESAERPQPPTGYAAWFATLEGVAASGQKAFDEAWKQSRPEFKTFCVNHDKTAHADVKAKAAKKR